MKAKPATGADKALALETVYYSAPMPRDPATLTILGAVFDKVYFPGVYFPKGGYSQADLDKEIARIEGLGPPRGDTATLLAMLHFTKHAKTLDGFCEFTSDGKTIWDQEHIPQEALEDLFFLMHERPSPDWRPIFDTGHHKMLPGSSEHVTYPGDYHYLFYAVAEAKRRGIPLLNDRPGQIPLAAAEQGGLHTDANTLSTILAIECAKLALPEMPVMTPEMLMEFRSENVEPLRVYRRAMLQYAGKLGGSLKDLPPDEIERQTKFFVDTEIVPTFDALRASFNDPARPWYQRWMDGVHVLAGLGSGFIGLGPKSAIAIAVAQTIRVLTKEIIAEGEHRAAMKRSDLYYLLRLERAHRSK